MDTMKTDLEFELNDKKAELEEFRDRLKSV